MIREISAHTKECTFIIRVPGKNGFPYPVGTCFFISRNGHFITANHLIDDVTDFSKVRLNQPTGEHVFNISLIEKWERYDIALLKADLNLNQLRFKNAKNKFLKGRKEFPHLEIDFEEKSEGVQIYIYGYYLSKLTGNNFIKFENINPKVTSGIISSAKDDNITIQSINNLKTYTIDKSLFDIYSGSPAIMNNTGKVFGVCACFQPFSLQNHKNEKTKLPTDFSFISSLTNIREFLVSELKL